MNIFFEDEHMIIVQKPPKTLSQKDDSGDLDLCTELEEYLHLKKLYVVHRLDRPVGGIIVYAKSKKAADKLTNCIKERAFHKTYLCVVCGQADPVAATLTDYLKKKSGQNLSVAVHKNNDGAKDAILHYQALQSLQVKRDKLSLVRVQLETGRHHQIRVQMSSHGLPLWGDAKYHPQARRKRNWTQIALWSHKLKFIHPFTGEDICIIDYPPNVEPWSLFELDKSGQTAFL